jgi:hypothetical protein
MANHLLVPIILITWFPTSTSILNKLVIVAAGATTKSKTNQNND